jgi:TonB family protein
MSNVRSHQLVPAMRAASETAAICLGFFLTSVNAQWVTPPTIVVPAPMPAPHQPRIEHCIPPEYPPAALRAEAQGTTTVELRVRPDGTVAESQVVKSAGESRAHKLLDRVTQDAFLKCKFNSIGAEVERTTRLSYVFSFSEEPSKSGK